jgi:hypothetical protein
LDRWQGTVADDGAADRESLGLDGHPVALEAWHDSHAMRQRAGEIDVERYW